MEKAEALPLIYIRSALRSKDVSFTLLHLLILSEVGLKLSDNRCQYTVHKYTGTFTCTQAQSQLGLKGCAC